ncbi:hypothetical protein JAO73_10550 [Hymenobacter sp. BT523]|uniref:hypothetical protein n=1 Tax=Hymenobacter sp. BT523 TaxID=2795725 RepID=UPI0018EAC69F|nr:hypothetical protein [Hymenobacter sp. BT523]MBJ6109455.1 hypothetical protein [Hymenobacter sp. BT523]
MDHIDIPVRPHLVKFLQYHLGERYFLSVSDPYGILLFQLLRRPVHDARRDDVLEEYKGVFTLHLGAYAGKHGLKELTGKTVYEFNNFAHEMMRADLHSFVDLATDHGQIEKYAVEQFMAKYDFEEQDIKYDTLLKSWRRFAADRKAKKKRAPHLTPTRQLKDLKKALLATPPPIPVTARPAA